MAATTRVYLAEVGDKKRLVRATHPSPVSAHIARDMVKVRVATQDDLLACVKAGIEVETIKGEQQELPA